MCTVTFLPDAVGGYLLTTNRDESHARGRGRPPERLVVGGRAVLAPRDADAGGTWVDVDQAGAALCLLNGDGPAAAAAPDDPVSRCLLVLELMEAGRAADVAALLRDRLGRDGLPYRPFKLVAVTPGDVGQPAHTLHALWDGAALRFGEISGPCVVVSSTYRRESVARRRSEAWLRFLEDRPAEGGELRRAVAAFHAGHAPGVAHGDAFSVCMHREDARTVSSTMVGVGPARIELDYREGWPCEGGPLVSAALDRLG